MPSVEQALLARVQPYMLAVRARAVLNAEVSKGCLPDIAPQPVALEPPYLPIQAALAPRQAVAELNSLPWVQETPPPDNEAVRLQIWLSPQQQCDWLRSELFLKQLANVRSRVAFEVVGNAEGVTFQVLCQPDDVPVVQAAFIGQFELCEMPPSTCDPMCGIPSASWTQAVFCDFYPPPPYSHLLTRPDELRRFPLASLATVLSRICGPALGIYQVVFVPVLTEHNWHENVQALMDLEYNAKLQHGIIDPRRFAQPTPGNDEHHMATAVELKAHNDKPFFAAALRICVLDGVEQAESHIRSVAGVAALIQHGGRPLGVLTEEDYRARLAPDAVRRMFALGLVHRPGFLVNSCELTSLIHIPAPEATCHIRTTPMNRLDPWPPDDSLRVGTPIGYCDHAGRRVSVCIPYDMRDKHTHAIGRTGVGKTNMLEGMVLDDAGRGAGLAVFDPHGALIRRLLQLLPERDVQRTIYFDPGDPEWIPCWNPLRPIPGQDIGHTADDLVSAFKSFVTGWGDRLEHLLRHVLHGAISLPGSTLLDVYKLLRTKTPESEVLRLKMLEAVDNEAARQFWTHDLLKYGKDDFGPPRNKISKLLLSGPVSLMLSQPESAFNIRDIMDNGMILLVDLHRVGSQVRNILGCLMLAMMYLSAISRERDSNKRLPEFHIYCDEAHRFVTDALEDTISETRQFNVGLTLSHQYLSQFTISKTDALSSVGTTIIFNVDTKDAQHLKKDLQGRVEVDDLASLDYWQAIARVGNRVVRFRTNRPRDIPKPNFREQIIQNSRAHYYKPAHLLREATRSARQVSEQGMPEPSITAVSLQELKYDTF